MRRRIVELHCLDPAEEVVVTRVLRVGSGGGEIRFGDQFVGLVVQTVMEVTAEKAVDQRGLRLIVVAKGSGSLCSKEQAKERNVNEREKRQRTRKGREGKVRTVVHQRARLRVRKPVQEQTRPWPQSGPCFCGSETVSSARSHWQGQWHRSRSLAR